MFPLSSGSHTDGSAEPKDTRLGAGEAHSHVALARRTGLISGACVPVSALPGSRSLLLAAWPLIRMALLCLLGPVLRVPSSVPSSPECWWRELGGVRLPPPGPGFWRTRGLLALYQTT